MPSRMNRTTNGVAATSEDQPSEPRTGSRTCLYIFHLTVEQDRWALSTEGDLPDALRRQTANRGVEDLDCVRRPDFRPQGLDRRGHLHQAARIRGDQQCRAGREDVTRLALAQFAGRVRLEDVVDSRGTTTDLAFGDFADAQLRNSGQQGTRL